MKIIKLFVMLLLLSIGLKAQNTYNFSKNFTQTGIGDWIQFGYLNSVPTGTYVNVKAWGHYAYQLFYVEFELTAITYGNIGQDWIEVASKLSNGFDGQQNFALDARYKCVSDCALEFRLRRLSGGGEAGTINFWIESNSVFTEANIQGTAGVVSTGYLGNNGGWKFPVSTGFFNETNQGLFITRQGDVSIGTTDAKGYKLAVAGNVAAESVKVALQGSWPDYVFAKDYRLSSLEDVEKHIKEKGHLPGIPSAKEVGNNGVNLGEMDVMLLKKIEELTLHLINLKKENDSMKSERHFFRNELSTLKNEINHLRREN